MYSLDNDVSSPGLPNGEAYHNGGGGGSVSDAEYREDRLLDRLLMPFN